MRKVQSDRFIIELIIFCIILALLAGMMFCVSSRQALKENATRTLSSVSSMSQTTRSVVIDAGHGGEDGGAVGVNGILEKDVNLELSNILADMLRFSGYNVIMTRTEDKLLYDRDTDYTGRKKSLDLRARLEIANANLDAPLISIHMNSFGSPKYSGLQVYYSKNRGDSRDLALCIQDRVKSSLQAENNRKIKPAGSSIYLLDRARGTAVLVECGFLSNSEECDRLSDASYRKKLAFSIFGAVDEYFDKNTDTGNTNNAYDEEESKDRSIAARNSGGDLRFFDSLRG